MHYALDLWVHQWRKRNARGRVIIVRYCDDFVMGFQYGADARQMLVQLKERLAKFKLPKRVIFVPDLPRNTMGKVQKNALRDQYGGIYKA